MDGQLKVAVVGGGAAGFFAALSAAEHHPSAQVVLFEKTAKLLSKVKISGGGRCNVTHACFSPAKLAKHYPRGGKHLKKAFSAFQAADTVAWLPESRLSVWTPAPSPLVLALRPARVHPRARRSRCCPGRCATPVALCPSRSRSPRTPRESKKSP